MRNELEPSPTPTEESKFSGNMNMLLSRSGWQPRIPRPAFAKHNYKPSVISTKTLRVSLPCLHSRRTLIRFDKNQEKWQNRAKVGRLGSFFGDTYKWTHSHGIWEEISVHTCARTLHVTACWEPHKEVWKYDLKSRLSRQPIIRRRVSCGPSGPTVEPHTGCRVGRTWPLVAAFSHWYSRCAATRRRLKIPNCSVCPNTTHNPLCQAAVADSEK